MNYKRTEIASLIFQRLLNQKSQLAAQFSTSKSAIGHFYIDELLPKEMATEVFKAFPNIKNTIQKKNLKEYKHVAYQMDAYHPLLKEIIYAFQDEKIVTLIGEICQLQMISPDKNLYAGGLSLMQKDNFLNPHLDNSHDKDRAMWRVLNLLYYVSPDWQASDGGDLELWPAGLKDKPQVIESKFNRLVVMATHQRSLHSVNKVLGDQIRCCVSNYYFSDNPNHKYDRFHVTSFRGRPKQKIRDLFLQFENSLRMGLRKVFKKGIRENPHHYKNEGGDS